MMTSLNISHQMQLSWPYSFQKCFSRRLFSTQDLQNPKLQRKMCPLTKNHHPVAASAANDGIETKYVKTLADFKSKYNQIKVLEVSRRADNQFAGSRLLLLDNPGNIHSVSFLLKHLTCTYFDVFATFPTILPPGPIGILGFGAGSAARLILHLYPNSIIHGWELDPSVISVGREYFGLLELEKQNPDSLFVNIGDAMDANVEGGFAGIIVDLFSKGSLVPELQEVGTWEKFRRRLKIGGRVMVNCGGSCVEAEEKSRDGDVVMKETLKAMSVVFPEELFVLNVGYRNDDSLVALTGTLPERKTWKDALPTAELRPYVHMWAPYICKNS